MAIGSTGGSDSLKVSIEATDNASKVIDGLADKVEKLDGSKTKVSVDVDDNASDALGDIQDTTKDLDGTKAEVSVEADDNASAPLEDVQGAVKQLDGTDAKVSVDADTTDATRNIDDILEKVDKIGGEAANLILTSNASEITREITDLVTEVQTLDSQSVEFQVKADRIQALEGDLERLSAKAREINGTPIELDTRRAVSGLDDVARSAGSSKSVLANMVGNATQDLGALGGVAGSAGVAIGQMGEYMVDAKADGDQLGSVLRNFGKIALPIAGIAAFTQVLGEMVSAGKEVQELQSDRVQSFFEDISSSAGDAADVFAQFREEIEKTGQLKFGQPGEGFLGIAPGIEDVLPLLDKAKINLEGFQTLVEEFPQRGAGMLDHLKSLGLSGGEAEQVLNALIQTTSAKMAADEQAAQVQRFLGDATAETTAKVEAQQGVLGLVASTATEAFSAAVDVTGEWQQSIRDTQGALDDFAASLDGLELDSLNEAFGADNSLLDAAGDIRDISGAIDDLSTKAEGLDLSDALDTSDVKFDGLLDAIDALRPQIQTKVAEAFAAGGPEAAKQTAAGFVDQIYNELGGKLSKEKITQLLGLGDLEAKIKVAVDETAMATARAELDGLIALTGQDAFLLSVKLALDAGEITPETARALIEPKLKAAGVKVPTALGEPDTTAVVNAEIFKQQLEIKARLGADPSPAQAELDGWVQAATNTTGTSTLDANNEPAISKNRAWENDGNSSTATSTLDADNEPGLSKNRAWENDGNSSTATANLAADPTQANATISDVINGDYSTTIFGKGDMSDADSDAKSLGPYHPTVRGQYTGTDGVPTSITVKIRGAISGIFGLKKGGIAPRDGLSIAGENFRPEILNDKFLISSPTLIPPGTKVTGERDTARLLAKAGISPNGDVFGKLTTLLEGLPALLEKANRAPAVEVKIDERTVAAVVQRSTAKSVKAATTRLAVSRAMAR